MDEKTEQLRDIFMEVADEGTVNEILKRGADSDVGPFDLLELFGEDSLREALSERQEETDATVYEPVF